MALLRFSGARYYPMRHWISTLHEFLRAVAKLRSPVEALRLLAASVESTRNRVGATVRAALVRLAVGRHSKPEVVQLEEVPTYVKESGGQVINFHKCTKQWREVRAKRISSKLLTAQRTRGSPTRRAAPSRSRW